MNDYIVKISADNFEKPYTIADRNELWCEIENIRDYLYSLESLWREITDVVGLGGDFSEIV